MLHAIMIALERDKAHYERISVHYCAPVLSGEAKITRLRHESPQEPAFIISDIGSAYFNISLFFGSLLAQLSGRLGTDFRNIGHYSGNDHLELTWKTGHP